MDVNVACGMRFTDIGGKNIMKRKIFFNAFGKDKILCLRENGEYWRLVYFDVKLIAAHHKEEIPDGRAVFVLFPDLFQ